MKRAAGQIGICALGLILFCVIGRFAFFSSYTAYLDVYPGQESRENLQMEVEDPEILSVQHMEPLRDGGMRIHVQPKQEGETWVNLRNGEGQDAATLGFRVDRFQTVYDKSTGGFTGDIAVIIAVTLFWGLTGLIMIRSYLRAKGPEFYSYATIYFSGFSLFAVVNFLVMLQNTVSHLLRPEEYNMLTVYSAIQGASRQFMMITTPLILCFALAMAVSNIELLRHATPRIQNVLGLIVSLLLILGTGLGWLLFTRDFAGPEWALRAQNTLENVYATAFVYFECMLAGAMISSLHAIRKKPETDKDFIVILGCWFRKDGTLPPLLRGRVDRAIAFWKKQKEETGREALFIPSGGQGRNESMPEAEAMARYLREQGIPERLIHPENKSANTWENMAFSRKIIEAEKPEGKTVFATTNYHVFRSGVWARDAGLPAEGIGSKTVWWYWPNAFMRECAGLLQKQWKLEILLLILMVAFFSLLSMVLG